MPRYFLSYRRDDTDGNILAHMIFRELRHKYGEGSAFLDVDSRSPGLSFPTKVSNALSNADAVLVIIGSAWVAELEARKNDSRDWVRYEVAESLKRPFLPVVPVCRSGVQPPRAEQLPPELEDLAWRDGVALDPFSDFDAHFTRLLTDLERVTDELRTAKESHSREKSGAVTRLATTIRLVANVRQVQQHLRHSQIAKVASLIAVRAQQIDCGFA